jgi:hypothetical protein
MAQTRKRRRRKHRGTQGGGIDRRGPRGRPRTREEAKARARQKRKPVKGADRRDYAPTWRSAFNRAALAAGVFFLLAVLLLKQTPIQALAISVLLMGFYVPMGYYVDRFIWRRRMAKQRAAREARANGRP